MPYALELLPAAARKLARLDRPVQVRISTAIEALSSEPRPPGVKKLTGPSGVWRIRVGDYRILYRIIDRKLLVLMIDLGHRSEIYR